LYIYFAIVAVAIQACIKKSAEQQNINLGQDYYPTTLGKFVEYDVDSVVFNELSSVPDTFRYRIKEKFTAHFSDNEGKQAIRLERFIKKYNPSLLYDSIPYQIKEVWMSNASNKNIQVVEGNIRFTKLIFPVQQNSSWNGNAYNSLGEWLYKYTYIDKTETINQVNLDKVLLVTQRDDYTQIYHHFYIEKYAKGVGLVYREIKDIYSNNVISGIPVEQRIEKGVIYKQQIINYGYE